METSKIRLHSIGARSLIYQDIRPGLANNFDLSDCDTLLPASELTNKSSATTYQIRLDKPSRDWVLPKAEFYLILAAQTNPSLCETNPLESYKINVTKTQELIDLISKKGGRVIYPSSNLVFSPDRPLYECNSHLNPLGQYGKQKAEMERWIMNKHAKSGHIVLRMTKVWSQRAKFYLRWERERVDGIPIKVSRNRLLSPLTPQGLERALYFLTGKFHFDRSQIINISANFSISQTVLAREIYKIRNINDVFFEEVDEPTTSKTGLIYNSLKNCLPDWEEFNEEFFYKHLKLTLPIQKL